MKYERFMNEENKVVRYPHYNSDFEIDSIYFVLFDKETNNIRGRIIVGVNKENEVTSITMDLDAMNEQEKDIFKVFVSENMNITDYNTVNKDIPRQLIK